MNVIKIWGVFIDFSILFDGVSSETPLYINYLNVKRYEKDSFDCCGSIVCCSLLLQKRRQGVR